MSEEKKLWEIVISVPRDIPGAYPLRAKTKYFCAAIATSEEEAKALLYKNIKSDIKFDIIRITEAANNRPFTIIGGVRFG